MNEMDKKRNGLRQGSIIKALALRNMEAFYAETKEEALKIALDIIPKGATVSNGGATSAREIGLIDAIIEGDYNYLDRDGAKDPAEKRRLELETLSNCDYFIAGVNGMSENGVIVNVDGNANRVAAICYGPKHVLFIVGMNKIVHSEEDAYNRAKYIAAPINAQRFGLSTPCGLTGKCGECLMEQCICCQIVTTRYSKHKDRIKVILVNEDLGF
ncbi:MAG: lactate utilization protein [Lachnospiraceae bacterium]|nr:lactate utilization protein [Lachnospiraceae bacterium]